MSFVEWFAGLWSIKSEEPKEVDVIAPLSYGALPNGRLANGTSAALHRAIAYHKKFPEAIIAFVNTPNCFSGSELIEGRLKKETLRYAIIPKKSVLDAGSALNSVLEARAVKERLMQAGINSENILVIADLFHSRSAELIWKKTFPKSKILMCTFSYRLAFQFDHPEFLVRGLGRWIATNILRYLVVKMLGLRVASRITHSSEFPFKIS